MAKKQTEFPFSLEDRTGCLTYPIIAIEETFEAVRVVYRQIFPYQRVVDHTILRMHIAPDREASIKERTIYYVPPASENPISTHIDALRRMALEDGATPEAIRLLSKLQPWSKKEEHTMAEKLKAKGTAAKPDKENLKAAAKSTPVGGKGASKNKGNAEALAKAREARAAAAGPDKRKITVLKKDHGARAGTTRADLLNKIYKAKTVQAAVDAGVKKSDVSWAARSGYISLS